MKKCPYCGQTWADDMTVCPTDQFALVPMDAKHTPLCEARVSVTGYVEQRSGPRGLARTVFGDALRIRDGLGKLALWENHVTLKTIGGPYNIRYKTISRLEKRWWWWEMDWEDSSSEGEVCLCAWNLRPLVEQMRARMDKETTG